MSYRQVARERTQFLMTHLQISAIVRPHAGDIADAFILMQDNSLARTVPVSMTFLDDEAISVMNLPARSTDLDPIEHTLDNLSRRIRQRPEKVQNLIDALVQELQAIPQKGIRSMPCRFQECVNFRVGHTSYW